MNLEMLPCRYGPMIFPSADEYVGGSLREYGEYSQYEVDGFRQILREGDCAIDLGANIGALTVPMGKFVGPSGLIIAVEPQLPLSYICASNALINGVNAIVKQHAVGKEAGIVKVPNMNYKIVGNYGNVSMNVPAPSTYDVAQVSMDDYYLPQIQRPVRLIKIDVEGMECDVIDGASKFIAQHQPILFVENDRQSTVDIVAAKIKEIGYSAYWHVTPLFNENNFRENKINKMGATASFNMLCGPPSGPNQLEIEGMLEVTPESIDFFRARLMKDE